MGPIGLILNVERDGERVLISTVAPEGVRGVSRTGLGGAFRTLEGERPRYVEVRAPLDGHSLRAAERLVAACRKLRLDVWLQVG